MKPVLTTAILSAALIVPLGCAESAAPPSDRYSASASSPQTQHPGAVSDEELTLQAQPASAEIQPTATKESQQEQPTLNPLSPSGNTIQPGGVPLGVPGTTARNPGTVPPTAPSGGNTAGAIGR